MRLIRTTGLLVLGLLAGGVFAQNAALVFDDQPGAELHLGTPAFAPEGLCKSNMASDSVCAFKTILVEIDGEEVTPSTKRRVYRVSPGTHTIVVNHRPLGKERTKRGRVGLSQLTIAEYGHPGEIELELKDGEVWQVYARRTEITDDKPVGWEGVATKTR